MLNPAGCMPHTCRAHDAEQRIVVDRPAWHLVVEHLGGRASAVFEIQNDVMDTDRLKRFEKLQHDFSPTAKAQVNRRWGRIGARTQINVERLGKRLEDRGAGGCHSGSPLRGHFRLLDERPRISDPPVGMGLKRL